MQTCQCNAPIQVRPDVTGMVTCNCGRKHFYKNNRVYKTWEPEGPCECMLHRYDQVHIYKNKVYSHSQATWDQVLRYANTGEIETYPSSLYQHGMTADDLRIAAFSYEDCPTCDKMEKIAKPLGELHPRCKQCLCG